MKLTLSDLARVILAFALAFSATMSYDRTVRIRGADPGALLCADGMIISTILAGFAGVFVRPGPRRVASVQALVLGMALCFLMLVAWQGSKTIPRHLRGGGANNLDGEDWNTILTALGAAVFAGSLVVRLGHRALGFFARRRSSG